MTNESYISDDSVLETMFISVDDTDSREGNCTTFVATQIIKGLLTKGSVDIIGYPHLVRLNPAVPWKTRGNASIVIEIGIGKGDKRKIGQISGKDVFSYPESAGDCCDKETVLERVIPIVMDDRSFDSQSGIVVSENRPDPELYWLGVRTIMSRDIIDKELERISASSYSVNGGRGLIGATCGMAWMPGDSTYELLAYRKRENWGTERNVDALSIREMDARFPGTFNSWEERFQKVTMVPSTPCPILYGIRGDDDSELPEAHRSIISEEEDRWMIFLTNQATDDHIIHGSGELIPDRSYSISGMVIGDAKHMRGGHTFVDIDTTYGTITCGAYEPSKEFRYLFDNLIPGDEVTVVGELRSDPRTLNVEKVHVDKVADDVRKTSNPICTSCGRRMKSIGKDAGYRCRECRTRSSDVKMETRTRQVVPGWYEPPAAARRHLSKPLKRMNELQPIEFVNRRIE